MCCVQAVDRKFKAVKEEPTPVFTSPGPRLIAPDVPLASYVGHCCTVIACRNRSVPSFAAGAVMCWLTFLAMASGAGVHCMSSCKRIPIPQCVCPALVRYHINTDRCHRPLFTGLGCH